MSYANLKYHIIFSTKDRRPMIRPDILSRLAQYIGGTTRELKGTLLEANGPEDHLHLCAQVHPTVAVSDFVGKIKANSSRWIHETFPDLRMFDWQDGYAAFTAAQSGMELLGRYIRGQQDHHRKVSFVQELIKLLRLHGIEFDERFLFA